MALTGEADIVPRGLPLGLPLGDLDMKPLGLPLGLLPLTGDGELLLPNVIALIGDVECLSPVPLPSEIGFARMSILDGDLEPIPGLPLPSLGLRLLPRAGLLPLPGLRAGLSIGLCRGLAGRAGLPDRRKFTSAPWVMTDSIATALILIFLPDRVMPPVTSSPDGLSGDNFSDSIFSGLTDLLLIPI